MTGMPTTVNIHDAKTNFSRLVERARQGERITIARAGVPVAMLVAIEPKTLARRPIGMDRGKVVIHEDFDDPMPEFDPDYAHPLDPLLERRQ
jgi:prevent-host-death family protein